MTVTHMESSLDITLMDVHFTSYASVPPLWKCPSLKYLRSYIFQSSSLEIIILNIIFMKTIRKLEEWSQYEASASG